MSIELSPARVVDKRVDKTAEKSANYRNGSTPGGAEAPRTDSGFAAEMKRLSAKEAQNKAEAKAEKKAEKKADTPSSASSAASSTDKNADKNVDKVTDKSADHAADKDAAATADPSPSGADAAQASFTTAEGTTQLTTDLPPAGVALTLTAGMVAQDAAPPVGTGIPPAVTVLADGVVAQDAALPGGTAALASVRTPGSPLSIASGSDASRVSTAQRATDLPPADMAVVDGVLAPESALPTGTAEMARERPPGSPLQTATDGNASDAHLAGWSSLAPQGQGEYLAEPAGTVHAGVVGHQAHARAASGQADSKLIGTAELQQVQTAAQQPVAVAASDITSALAATGDAWFRQHERTQAASIAIGSPGSSALGLEAAMGAGVGGAGAGPMVYEVSAPQATVADTRVAETVSYWASQGGIQNAELTLDGFGKDPVEVSISLNNDQAQIGFRTDQAEVRQALEGAASQLKDMLSGEGLQLVGVSVGSSGRDSAGGDDPRQRSQQARRSALAAAASVPLSASVNRSLARPVGRSLDLFV